MRFILFFVLLAVVATVLDRNGVELYSTTVSSSVESLIPEVKDQRILSLQQESKNWELRSLAPSMVNMHTTANENYWADAWFHAGYLDTTSREVSWHYTVDDNYVLKHFSHDKITFGAGWECNQVGINIEVTQYEGQDVEKTFKNLYYLLDELEKEIPNYELTTHKECTGKNCPSWLPLKYSDLRYRNENIYNFEKSKRYVNKYMPLAVQEMQLHGIPASITLAQGLLESNVAESELAQVNNHFGIKCTSRTCKAGHCVNKSDDSHKDFFRAYNSVQESYEAHSQVLLKPRYSSLFQLPKDDLEGWARGLRKCGYATDPLYPEKLLGIIYRFGLWEYDSYQIN